MNRLWNKNFTTLTIGSFISALGNSVAAIAFGILIYIETESPLTLALFTIANIIPRVLANFLVGPFIDRNSRVKIIYMIDFAYFVIFGAIAFILFQGYFNVIVFTIVGGVLGAIDSTYQVAFMSLFPETIEGNNHSQAYSISSLIWPISSAIMAPIAAYLIDTFDNGIAYLMVFNSMTFLITATLETRIRVKEHLNTSKPERFKFIKDLKEGFKYYKVEKGIAGIGILFMVFSFGYAVTNLLRMPFFVEHNIYTIQHFSYLVTASSIGRVIGGLIHYKIKIPKHLKYRIAVTVYFTVEILSAVTLLSPYVLMIAFSFFIGLFSVTSFNIRMSSTQTYVGSQIRGRVNSVFQLLWNTGAIFGTLLAGVAAEYTNIPYEWIIFGVVFFSIPTIILIPLRMRKEFENIYNVEL